MAHRDGTVLAIDVGTSSLKAVTFGPDGRLLCQATVDYEMHSPQAGVQEQDPADWMQAFESVVRQLDPGPALAAIVFTGTMQNTMAFDRAGRPLGRAILYSDAGVSADQLDACLARLPADFAARIGNQPDSAMPIFRLMSADPRLTRSASVHYHFGAKDSLIERLTGRAVIDPTTATTTGLFDLAARAWDDTLVEAAGLSHAQLPAVMPADAIVGQILSAEAARLSLPQDVNVIVGSGDAGAATWGVGGPDGGAVHAYLGTTGWVAATEPPAGRPAPSDLYRLAAPLGSTTIAIAPLLQAGSALDWVESLGAGDGSLDLDAVDRTPPSALFLPYLAGERSPFRDRDVRAAFLGLDAQTRPAHLAYAALEGLCHAIRDNLDLLARPFATMPLIGGVAENPLLRQLLADTLGVPVTVTADPRLATAHGAFLFAAAALGKTVQAVSPTSVTAPRPERRPRADRRFQAYRLAQQTARTIASDLLAAPETL